MALRHLVRGTDPEQNEPVSSEHKKPIRPWREIAAEAKRETDPTRLYELVQELTRSVYECLRSKSHSAAQSD
jgi:hypothetical protein